MASVPKADWIALGTHTLSERSGVDIPTYRENHELDDSPP